MERLRSTKAKESAELIALEAGCIQPHILLKIWANGETACGITPNPSQQLACAIAAANYFAPKLQAIETRSEVTHRAVISAKPVSAEEWSARYSSTKITDNQTYQQLPEPIPAESIEIPGDSEALPLPLTHDAGEAD